MENLKNTIEALEAKLEKIKKDPNFDYRNKQYWEIDEKLYRLKRRYESLVYAETIKNKQYDASDGEIDLYLKNTIGKNGSREYLIYLHNTLTEIGKVIFWGQCDGEIPFRGNVSYCIDPEYRGHHYALKALNLMADKLLEDGITTIYISAESHNIPSIRTIELFGGIPRSDIDPHNIQAYECDLEKIRKKDTTPKIS